MIPIRSSIWPLGGRRCEALDAERRSGFTGPVLLGPLFGVSNYSSL